MRIADAAGVEELASGEYHYYENGKLRNIVEPWSLYRGSGGEFFISSQRLVKDAGICIEVEAALVDGRCQQALLSWHQNGSEQGASYRFNARGLEELLRDGSREAVAPQFDLFFPLMRVFTGPLLVNLLQRSPAKVLVPWIKDPAQRELLFTADISERSVEHVGRMQVSDGEVQMLEYNGGQYEQAANCILADGAWLQAYSWKMRQDALWEVRLATPLPLISCPDFTLV